MAEAPPKIDRAFLWCRKTFDNAEKLNLEAELLVRAGSTARALCLHQISLEECSKIENMGAWATSLLLGFEVDQNKILAAFRRHSLGSHTYVPAWGISARSRTAARVTALCREPL
jgi:AbiV family abortive infection protein